MCKLNCHRVKLINEKVMRTLKIITGFTGILFLALFTSGCRKDHWPFNLHGEGPVVTETRVVSNFEGIRLKINADIHISKDSVQELSISAQQNIIDNIETYVTGNLLTIDFDRNVKHHLPIDVYIKIPMLNKIQIDGSGNVSTTGDFSESNVDLEINGSGNINGNFFASSISSQISGSGDISLTGTATNHYAQIDGSGNIYSFGLITDHTDIDISGSGNSEVFANQTLDVKISGSGDVYYKGHPTVTVNISGSGSVINKN